jgi:hypothetical protein
VVVNVDPFGARRCLQRYAGPLYIKSDAGNVFSMMP